jgi:phytoene synthase
VDDLDTLVRRVDEDRWLASRFAPDQVRKRLIALYAVNYEIARTPETVSEAGLGAIRLEWWRAALEEIAEGFVARSHPALAAFHETARHVDLARTMMGIVEARSADLEAAPFRTWDALDAYVSRTARALMWAAAESTEASLGSVEQGRFLDLAARAWGYCGLLRAEPFWTARGRSFLPEGASSADVLERARSAYDAARPLARDLPAAAFAAIGYVALTPGYLRALERGKRETALFLRQATLIKASATGRL